MKGKLVKSVNPLVGMLGTLDMMVESMRGKDVSGRDTALTEELQGITIDTCKPVDTGVWETGILRDKIEGKWVIVSQYRTYEEAKEGHGSWVKLLSQNPEAEIEDIDIFGVL